MAEVIPPQAYAVTKEAGAIYNALAESSEYAAVMQSISFIDTSLKALLLHHFKKGRTSKDLLDPIGGVLGSFKAKCDVAYSLDLLSRKVKQDLDHLGQIRNRFAHSYLTINFREPKIAKLCDQLNCPDVFLETLIDKDNVEELRDDLRLSARIRFNVGVMSIVDLLVQMIADEGSV